MQQEFWTAVSAGAAVYSIVAATSASKLSNAVFESAADIPTSAAHAPVLSDAALQMQQDSEQLSRQIQQDSLALKPAWPMLRPDDDATLFW